MTSLIDVTQAPTRKRSGKPGTASGQFPAERRVRGPGFSTNRRIRRNPGPGSAALKNLTVPHFIRSPVFFLWYQYMTDEDEQIQELGKLLQGEAAVAEVFWRYRDRLERMIRFRMDPRLFGRVDPDDILQETWINVSRRISDYTGRPDVPFFIWLRQLTTQTLVDLHRQHLGAKMRNAGLEVSLQRTGGMATSQSIAAHLAGAVTSPSRAAQRQEEIENLRRALDTMEDIDREVLVLRHLEGLSNLETAHVLNLESSAASKRYLRAIKRLSTILPRSFNHSQG